MKKYIVGCFLLCITAFNSYAQRHEFGLGVGAFNYAGDLVRGYNFANVRPGGSVFYKYNFNHIVAIRGGVNGGLLHGSDNPPIDALAQQRQASFNVTLIELHALFEYNFLHFRDPKSLNTWSPYAYFGLAGFTFFGEPENGGDYSRFQPSIPLGIGAKIRIGKEWTLNIDWGLRMTFFDYIDGISDGDITVKNYQYGNKYDNDWYNYFSLSFSYIIYKVHCPFDFY